MKSKVTLLCLLLLFFGSSAALFAQVTEKYEFTQVLETFDEGTRIREWKVVGSRYTKQGYPVLRYADAYPKSMKNIVEDENSQRVLGVNAEFDRAGYNYFEIIPVDKTTQEYSPIYFQGVVENIDLWVWGANYRYQLEVCLMDYHGIIHRLPVCSLEFIGWQNKKVSIPHTIPQMVRQIPSARPLRLTKFIVTTGMKERVDSFYVYLDHVKYLTNRYHDQFDGDELIDQDRIKEIWGAAPSASTSPTP